MEKLNEVVGVCPSCGKKTFKVELFLYDLPVEGRSILLVGRCESCGYRDAHIYPLETGKPIRREYILNEENLRKIVYLPGETKVRIPEIGAELELTPAFRGRITTVEGILRMIEEDVGSPEVSKKVEEIISGRRKAKLIIENANGLFREIEPRA